MLALSIRQPFAELILRGIKTVEFRSRSTRIIGERFWIYASQGSGFGGQGSGKTWSRDLAAANHLPEWMLELAEQIKLIPAELELPRGVIVGSAVIARVTQSGDWFQWHLQDVERASTPRKPKRHPQPVWFEPF